MPDNAVNVNTLTPEQENAMHGKFLVFSLLEQHFAIAISYVVDIINVQPITRVPNCPHFVKGITNLRGKVIPIVDLRLRFGKEQQEYNDRTCIIVVEDMGVSVGFIVDRVAEVINLDDEEISPPPNFNQSIDTRFVEGVGKSAHGIVLILNCMTVMDDDLVKVHSEVE